MVHGEGRCPWRARGWVRLADRLRRPVEGRPSSNHRAKSRALASLRFRSISSSRRPNSVKPGHWMPRPPMLKLLAGSQQHSLRTKPWGTAVSGGGMASQAELRSPDHPGSLESPQASALDVSTYGCQGYRSQRKPSCSSISRPAMVARAIETAAHRTNWSLIVSIRNGNLSAWGPGRVHISPPLPNLGARLSASRPS
jgi:hypothetical protein